MSKKQNAFQIDIRDNVATALEDINPGTVFLLGEPTLCSIKSAMKIPKGHKISLKAISIGEDIIKYGVSIGRANTEIKAGSLVHIHNMESAYDERSKHLDVVTGAPKDTSYE